MQLFLEETSLVARPAIGFDELKARLEARLKWMGIKVGSGFSGSGGGGEGHSHTVSVSSVVDRLSVWRVNVHTASTAGTS